MKSYGGIPNEEDLIPLLETQQKEVQDAIVKAAEQIQETADEGKNEVLEALNYVLEQSTIHKQDVERDLKDTRENTDQLYDALQSYAAHTEESMTLFTQELRNNVRNLKFLVYGLIVLNLGTLGLVGATLSWVLP